jgi:hypothetical protein
MSNLEEIMGCDWWLLPIEPGMGDSYMVPVREQDLNMAGHE